MRSLPAILLALQILAVGAYAAAAALTGGLENNAEAERLLESLGYLSRDPQAPRPCDERAAADALYDCHAAAVNCALRGGQP